MNISGIEISNFRSIGPEPVILKPWRKCNILIGQNNSGKSNVIKAIKLISDRIHGDNSIPFNELDLHNRNHENVFSYKLEFKPDSPDEYKLSELAETDTFWFSYIWKFNSSPSLTDNNFTLLRDGVKANELLEKLIGKHWDHIPEPRHIKNEFSNEGPNIFGNHFLQHVPKVKVIPVFRQIVEGSEYDFNGTHLIGLLNTWQHPVIGKDQDRKKFDRIENLVQILIHLPNAVLEVTENKELIITDNNLRLPLAYYGTGIHELIILGTAILSMEKEICCIEEPEIHFHPQLQREFIEFIITKTSNTFLLSTHSPTYININTYLQSTEPDLVQNFHLSSSNGSTTGITIIEDEHSLILLNDLGVKASDILQSNCVIWVEGPTDRIYLNHWIKLLIDELTEGFNYSIMFYGGRLLSHLSLDRNNNYDNFIQLLRINQHAIVVMDSDKKNENDNINDTKNRIKEECNKIGVYCWITDGQEIENYLPESVITKTFNIKGTNETLIKLTPFRNFNEYVKKITKSTGNEFIDYSKDKVDYSRKLVRNFQKIDMTSELKGHINNIIEKIKSWNI